MENMSVEDKKRIYKNILKLNKDLIKLKKKLKNCKENIENVSFITSDAGETPNFGMLYDMDNNWDWDNWTFKIKLF